MKNILTAVFGFMQLTPTPAPLKKFRRCSFEQKLAMVWTLSVWLEPFVPAAGRSSPRPCVDPHGREAIPMWDLRNTLPSLADAEEPPTHTHRREALPCRSTDISVSLGNVIDDYYKNVKFLIVTLLRFFFFSVRNATCTSATRVSYGCIFDRSTAPSLTQRSNTACPRPTCLLTWRRHAELEEGKGVSSVAILTLAFKDPNLYNHPKL